MNTKTTTVLAFCLGLLGLAWVGCSTVGGATEEATGTEVPEIKYKTLKPSAVDSAWSFLDDEKKNPFAKKEQKLEYATIGTSKYDTYFKDSARVIGSVRLADEHLTHLNKVAESGVIKEMIGGDRAAQLVKEDAELTYEDRKKIFTHTLQGDIDAIASKVDAVSSEAVSDFKKDLFEDYPNLEHVSKWHAPIKKTFKPKELKKEASKLAEKSSKLANQAQKDFTGPKASVAPKLSKEITSTGKKLSETSTRVPKMAKKMGETMKKIGTQLKEAGKKRMSDASSEK